MTLTFANRSRSYDPGRRQIRFVGYDGLFEIPFELELDALARRGTGSGQDKADHLAAFDAARDRVQSVACEV